MPKQHKVGKVRNLYNIHDNSARNKGNRRTWESPEGKKDWIGISVGRWRGGGPILIAGQPVAGQGR